jgi:hypothetical protein
LTHFIAYHYQCVLTAAKLLQCTANPGGLQANAYDAGLYQLAEKTFEYTMRAQNKVLPCRPAPIRVHRPSDKLKANGICVWCTASSNKLTCGERVHTDASGEAGEIRGRRFGPLEGIPPAEFERFSQRVDEFATAGYNAIRSKQPAWPPMEYVLLILYRQLLLLLYGSRPFASSS